MISGETVKPSVEGGQRDFRRGETSRMKSHQVTFPTSRERKACLDILPRQLSEIAQDAT